MFSISLAYVEVFANSFFHNGSLQSIDKAQNLLAIFGFAMQTHITLYKSNFKGDFFNRGGFRWL